MMSYIELQPEPEPQRTAHGVGHARAAARWRGARHRRILVPAARVSADPGREIYGITRSLIYAGAQNVLLPLWEVDDEATTLWTAAFYRAARDAPVADAVRRANVELRRQECMRRIQDSGPPSSWSDTDGSVLMSTDPIQLTLPAFGVARAPVVNVCAGETVTIRPARLGELIPAIFVYDEIHALVAKNDETRGDGVFEWTSPRETSLQIVIYSNSDQPLGYSIEVLAPAPTRAGTPRHRTPLCACFSQRIAGSRHAGRLRSPPSRQTVTRSRTARAWSACLAIIEWASWKDPASGASNSVRTRNITSSCCPRELCRSSALLRRRSSLGASGRMNTMRSCSCTDSTSSSTTRCGGPRSWRTTLASRDPPSPSAGLRKRRCGLQPRRPQRGAERRLASDGVIGSLEEGECRTHPCDRAQHGQPCARSARYQSSIATSRFARSRSSRPTSMRSSFAGSRAVFLSSVGPITLYASSRDARAARGREVRRLSSRWRGRTSTSSSRPASTLSMRPPSTRA